MEDQTYTIPQPDIAPEQAQPEVTVVEEVQLEPVQPVEDAPAQQTVQASEDAQEVTQAQEVALAACDSCGSVAELFEVPHHQVGNATVWHYCARCKAAHEKEYGVVAGLKELAQTHPAQADTPRVAGMLHQGMSVEDVKAQLDRERQPELEAEVV